MNQRIPTAPWSSTTIRVARAPNYRNPPAGTRQTHALRPKLVYMLVVEHTILSSVIDTALFVEHSAVIGDNPIVQLTDLSTTADRPFHSTRN